MAQCKKNKIKIYSHRVKLAVHIQINFNLPRNSEIDEISYLKFDVFN